MPRSNFGPEVRASMQGNANTPARTPTPRTGPRPPPGPSADVREQGADSSGNTGLPPPTRMPGPGRGGMPGMPHPGGGMMGPGGPGASAMPNPAHAAIAAGIAHAILGNRGVR